MKASHYRIKIKIFFFFFFIVFHWETSLTHSLTHSRQALIDYFRCDDISIIIIMIVNRIGILFYYLMVHKVKCQLNIIDYDDIDQIFDQFHHFHGWMHKYCLFFLNKTIHSFIKINVKAIRSEQFKNFNSQKRSLLLLLLCFLLLLNTMMLSTLLLLYQTSFTFPVWLVLVLLLHTQPLWSFIGHYR